MPKVRACNSSEMHSMSVCASSVEAGPGLEVRVYVHQQGYVGGLVEKACGRPGVRLVVSSSSSVVVNSLPLRNSRSRTR